MIYVFDTCALLGFYGDCDSNLSSQLWKKFYDLIKKERIISVSAVFTELDKKGKPLADWAKEHENTFFIPPNETETQIVNEINEKYPKLVPSNKQYAADPWVIAKAEIIPGYVVTEDGFYKDGTDKKEGIVPICRDRTVSCVSLKCFKIKENLKI